MLRYVLLKVAGQFPLLGLENRKERIDTNVSSVLDNPANGKAGTSTMDRDEQPLSEGLPRLGKACSVFSAKRRKQDFSEQPLRRRLPYSMERCLF